MKCRSGRCALEIVRRIGKEGVERVNGQKTGIVVMN
jgi:hypothetical protein